MSMQIQTVYLMGDSATQLIAKQLTKTVEPQIFNIVEAGYNQIEQLVYNSQSELYKTKPDIVIIFKNSHSLLNNFAKCNSIKKQQFAQTETDNLQGIINTIANKLLCKIILCNFYELPEPVFGNYANKTEQSFVFQLRKINYNLCQIAINNNNVYIADIASVVNHAGLNNAFDNRMLTLANMPLTIDVQKQFVCALNKILTAFTGQIKKCLVLDLDNTIWGGVIGDDGIENIQIGMLGIGKAFTAVQLYAKLLNNMGIILAVCSKNNEQTAKEPFIKHPEMVLKLDDIAVFVANFNNKADNIRYIKNILNIGFDSMVFIDDNPFERDFVRTNIPEITVPELPTDPANYAPYLISLNLFEPVSFTTLDHERTLQYKAEALRQNNKIAFANENEFLQSLQMNCSVVPFNSFNTPRVAQLSQRSNQFNLRTIRYTETDIQNIANNNQFITLCFELTDKYGTQGIIAAVILKKNTDNVFIDTWFMSCRVLSRTMEQFTINQIVKATFEHGYKTITAEFIPTLKNQLVSNLLPKLGFINTNDLWQLNINNYKTHNTFIKLL